MSQHLAQLVSKLGPICSGIPYNPALSGNLLAGVLLCSDWQAGVARLTLEVFLVLPDRSQQEILALALYKWSYSSMDMSVPVGNYGAPETMATDYQLQSQLENQTASQVSLISYQPPKLELKRNFKILLSIALSFHLQSITFLQTIPKYTLHI